VFLTSWLTTFSAPIDDLIVVLCAHSMAYPRKVVKRLLAQLLTDIFQCCIYRVGCLITFILKMRVNITEKHVYRKLKDTITFRGRCITVNPRKISRLDSIIATPAKLTA